MYKHVTEIEIKMRLNGRRCTFFISAPRLALPSNVACCSLLVEVGNDIKGGGRDVSTAC